MSIPIKHMLPRITASRHCAVMYFENTSLDNLAQWMTFSLFSSFNVITISFFRWESILSLPAVKYIPKTRDTKNVIMDLIVRSIAESVCDMMEGYSSFSQEENVCIRLINVSLIDFAI